MRRLILGTAGHIDHGKTALVRALTGIDTDRLPEEKRRGITIDLGFANLALAPDLELGIVDVPGHEAFVRNMLAGATGMDLALLVVAADEGVMPQTREHLAIVELLGVRAGVVAVTKSDLVETAWLELVMDELRRELAPTAFAQVPIIPVSARTGAGLENLREALARAVQRVDDRTADDLFRLPIDRVFTVRGTGTVTTGTVWSGRVERDQVVRVLPSGASARIRALQQHGREVVAVAAGQRAGIALAGIERQALRRGAVLVTGTAWQSSHMLTVRLRLLAHAAHSVRNRQRVRFHLGTAEVMGRVVTFGRTELGPGEECWAQLRLEAPVVARAGDCFVIRSYSPVTTIGGGRVVEPAPPKRPRLLPAEAEALSALLDRPVAEAIPARVRLAGWGGLPADRLPIETPHPPPAVGAALARLEATALLRVGGLLFSHELADSARQILAAAVERHHAAQPLRPGIDREELRRALPPHAPAALAEWALESLLAEGRIEARGRNVARAGFTPELAAEQRQARDELVRIFEQAGLAPPTVAELPAALGQRPDFWPLLKLLEQEGRLVSLTPDLYFARPALENAIRALRRELTAGIGLTPQEFKRVLPVSRKFLIPLLEYLDSTGVTQRRGDERFLRTNA